MSQGQNAFTPARDSLAAWIRNAGLIGEVPRLRPDLWASSLPWAVADLKGQSGPTFGPGHTSAHVWVFLRELLFPGSGWSAGASAGQTNRKRLPSLCLVNPGVPDTLQPGVPARHSHEQAPTTLGATFLQFLPNKNRQESPEGTHRNRGENHRGPGPLPPAMVHSLPHFLCPPVKGWSWVTSASHSHLAQGKPTFQDQYLYLVQLPAPKQVGLFRKTQRTLGPGFKTLHPV